MTLEEKYQEVISNRKANVTFNGEEVAIDIMDLFNYDVVNFIYLGTESESYLVQVANEIYEGLPELANFSDETNKKHSKRLREALYQVNSKVTKVTKANVEASCKMLQAYCNIRSWQYGYLITLKT